MESPAFTKWISTGGGFSGYEYNTTKMDDLGLARFQETSILMFKGQKPGTYDSRSLGTLKLLVNGSKNSIPC